MSRNTPCGLAGRVHLPAPYSCHPKAEVQAVHRRRLVQRAGNERRAELDTVGTPKSICFKLQTFGFKGCAYMSTQVVQYLWICLQIAHGHQKQ